MTKANRQDTVKIFYEGKLAHDKTFSLFENDQLEFTIGEGNVIRGLERAVIGMAPGEEKTVQIPADDAYGPYRKAAIRTIDLEKWPPNYPPPTIGMRVPMQQSDGRPLPGRIVDTSASDVTIDTNHPLAGHDVIFHIKLLDVVKHNAKAKRQPAQGQA